MVLREEGGEDGACMSVWMCICTWWRRGEHIEGREGLGAVRREGGRERWLRHSGTMRGTLPLEKMTIQRESDPLWQSLTSIFFHLHFFFSLKLWLFSRKPRQLTAEENMTGHTQKSLGDRGKGMHQSGESWLSLLFFLYPSPFFMYLLFFWFFFRTVYEGQKWDLLTVPHWLRGQNSSWYCMLPLILPSYLLTYSIHSVGGGRYAMKGGRRTLVSLRFS